MLLNPFIGQRTLCASLRQEFGAVWLQDRLARLAQRQCVFGAHFPMQAGDLLMRWAAVARTARADAAMATPVPQAPASRRTRHGPAAARRHLSHPRPTGVHRR